MQVNLPVTGQEYDYPADDVLVSTTDLQGRISHGNHAFFATSGYSRDELLGEAHSIVRHPDMPEEAFRDLWATIGRGRPWTGIVKNRRKNGDHYWVLANVTPVMQNGKPKSYMSVRFKPTRQQVAQAEALYRRIEAQRSSGRATFKLHAGHVRKLGWRDWPNRIYRLSFTTRMAMSLALMVASLLLPFMVGMSGMAALLAQMGTLGVIGVVLLWWFHTNIEAPMDRADVLAGEIAGCNLTSAVDLGGSGEMTMLLRRLWLIQFNLRAVIGDVRAEIDGISLMAKEVSRSSHDLSERTVSQATSLEHTTTAMRQLSNAVQHTAQAAEQVSEQSRQSNAVAARGGQAVEQAGVTMSAIEQSSNKVTDIISVIEGIAFQTNILALNAAVEAARAGEEGRGFAVVASEVRSLAQRSAAAAREIRVLIGTSVSQVNEGAQQMQQTAQTIEQVVQTVAQVSTLIHEISATTREQSTGIVQINDAVHELEQVTQQNAAFVKESAAATDSLNLSTVTLARSVQVFRVK
ncbi:MAG: chemotaxis protein [Burkholderiales bacterium RIFCSPLOWO2_12_FULL_61_40]|nr:MAG: chemotaxis protein [Burkholderiales bacterium RIFCSPLOWO2_12_FULL_61_40]